MKLSDVLIKPILSEKANKQAEKMNRYSFVVDKKSQQAGDQEGSRKFLWRSGG